MQITHCEVIPKKLSLRQPVQMARQEKIESIMAIYVRLETLDRRNAWGCAVTHPSLTGENTEDVLNAAQVCAQRATDLHPTNLEYSLAELMPYTQDFPAVKCAFDLAFYDLLGLAAGMPLYRLLGGYRNRIQTSVTIPICGVRDSVQIAEQRAQAGFRMFKIKGGVDPQEDVQRVRAIHRQMSNHHLRLDADGGYSVRDALAVATQLKDILEMIEQPVPEDDLDGLCEVTSKSPVPILADQSVKGPASALRLAAERTVDGVCVKVSTT